MRAMRVFFGLVVVGVLIGGLVRAGAEGDGVRDIVEGAGISRGVCVLWGIEDAGGPVAVARSSGFLVHALDSRGDVVDAAREAAEEAKLPIQRLLVERISLESLPHAENSVDLVVAVDLSAERIGSFPLADALRALRPGGKVIVAAQKSKALKALAKRAEKLGAQNVQVRDGRLTATKAEPEGVDDWSHWEHGPDNNPASTDAVIRAPYMTQWLAGPYYTGMPAVTTVAGGRTFLAMGHIAHHEREEPWLNLLIARNGYNGAELWRMRLPEGYMAHRSAFIATDDAFYMIALDGAGCAILDPETGRPKGDIRIPELRGQWKWMAIEDGVLYVLSGETPDPPETTIVRSKNSHWSWGELSAGYYAERVPWGFGTDLAAYDMRKGLLLWTHREEAPIDSRTLVLGGGDVFFYALESRVACLDAKTGAEEWAVDDEETLKLIEERGRNLTSTPGFRSTCYAVYTPAALCFAAQTRQNVVALSPKDGSLLWHREKTTSNPNTLYADGRILVGIGPGGTTEALDPLTGETLESLGFAKRSCARLTATPDSFFVRGDYDGVVRYDRKKKKVLLNAAMRPSCNDGVIGANGLLYIGPWLCDCNLSLMGATALRSAEGFDFKPRRSAGERLERNGAQEVAEFPVDSRDWATYRANNSRSASSPARIARQVSRAWMSWNETPFAPTAATAAGELIFLCGDDGKVRAIDRVTGWPKWTFQTAGPIMKPPTLWKGRAYVGSGDGYVYALEAATGRLVWRFQAGPTERRIMVYGSLCSTWPVNSGVLVHEGVAYAAAGIIDYDGTYVYALDAETGALKWENTTSGHLDDELRKGVSAQGSLTVAGGRLWLAGGNVVSPASYDLASGEYLGPGAGNGSPQANRGEQVGVVAGDHLVYGGRLLYSASENVVNPGSFRMARVPNRGDYVNGMLLHWGKIPQAWNDEQMLCVPGRLAKPMLCRVSDVLGQLDTTQGNARWSQPAVLRTPAPLWYANFGANEKQDIVSAAMGENAVVVVGRRHDQLSRNDRWSVGALSLADGSLMWAHELPGPANPGGLFIDRTGSVGVVLANGVIAFFSDSLIAERVKRLLESASEDENQRPGAIRDLLGRLETVQDVETRKLLVDGLEKLGAPIDAEARAAGCVTHWKLFGPVPWNEDAPIDKAFVGEPDVDVEKTVSVGGVEKAWRPYVTELPDGHVEFVRIFGEMPEHAVYAYAEVELGEARDLLLTIGSDDGYVLWLNGEEAGRNILQRGYTRDEDVHRVSVKKGTNTILVKLTQVMGGWDLNVRFTEEDGEPVSLGD